MEDNVISGLFYQEGFLTPEEERAIVSEIDHASWDTSLKRRVQHYGYLYDYKKKNIGQDPKTVKMPAWLLSLEAKVREHAKTESPFDQVIVNEYGPGQGIAGHIDCVPCFEDVIVSVSLSSACVMQFSRGAEKHELLLQPRSLLVLGGEARFLWKHGIKAVKNDKWRNTVLPRSRRISVTFRKIKA
jgi:alkylated DNA repair dioxygenase AlkB